MQFFSFAVISAFIGCYHYVAGDIYLHNPRGSNNRLNEASKGRSNANRIFDSQNNNNGGYNVGDKNNVPSVSEETQFNMAYFQSGQNHKVQSGKTGKTFFNIEWTNQHGCGDKDLDCNIVLQYKCQPDDEHQTLNHHAMRNGRTTSTLPHGNRGYTTRAYKDSRVKAESHVNYGMHEPWEWYDKCAKRNQNKGLFTADQKLKGTTSIYTRQNANGNRRGYECPEERDYYPYWHPTDWIDIAVLAKNKSICTYYKKESFNVKTKGECLEYYPNTKAFKHYSVHNNKIDCEKNKGLWLEFSNYLEESPLHRTEVACKAASTKSTPLIWAIPYRSENVDNLKIIDGDRNSLFRCLVALPPLECREAPYSRSNHLGNAANVVPMRYTWTLPHFPSKKVQRCVLRIRYNISTGDYQGFNTYSDQNDDPKNGVYSPVRGNPTVKIGLSQLPLQLAVNTAQFGRTFQDRSHLFKIFPRPKSTSNDDVIHNLNVRGKRGNIVQVYPAVEYDFVPKRMSIESNEKVHVQWTGSNSNPKENDGQGKQQTDRNNLVEMAGPSVNYPLTSEKPLSMFKKAEIIWASDLETKTKEDLILGMASSGYYDSLSMCHASPKKADLDQLLDKAPASYRGALLRFEPGVYYYMCTRNNNFSNRNQKGRLRVVSSEKQSKPTGVDASKIFTKS